MSPHRLTLIAFAITGVALAGTVAAVWWGWPVSPEPSDTDMGMAVIIDPGDEGALELGARLYAEHCASCHGADLGGQPDWRQRLANGRLPAPPHDETGHTWHHADAQLFAITKYGVGPFAPEGYESDMPAYEGVLADAEIAAVLAYIMSTWPPEVRERQAAISGR